MISCLRSRTIIALVRCLWIQRDGDVRRYGDSLVDSATVRHLQESLSLFCSGSMRQMDSDVDATNAMGAFGHGPFRIDAQALPRNTVPPAKLPDEIRDTTRHGPDKEFNGTHSRVPTPVLYRLVDDDTMLAAHNVVASAAMVGRREFHHGPPSPERFNTTDA
jgi:hypothetical protein